MSPASKGHAQPMHSHRPKETTMIRVTVSYPNLEAKRFDHAYYHAQHRQLLLD